MSDYERGYCFGIGGTNSREAHCIGDDIEGFQSRLTPQTEAEFFGWMKSSILTAADKGAAWSVVGVPGPVKRIGVKSIVNFTNIDGLGEEYDLVDALNAADPAIGRLVDAGHHIIGVNDADLAAQAAANRFAAANQLKVADIIVGTGVGGAEVERDLVAPTIFRPVKLSFEIGHIVVGEMPTETYENIYSGTAIKKATGFEAKDLPASHPMWAKVGRGVGKLASLMALVGDAELVVPSGGVGVGGYENYQSALHEFMDSLRHFGSRPQRNLLPEIQPIPQEYAQTFEMFGAPGVIRDVLTSAA